MAQIKYRDPVTGVYVPVGAGEDGYPDPTGATAGHVWTADGADGADWQAPAGGGAVDSVNTQTGDVVLGAGDVGADPAGSAAAAQTAAESTAATALTAHHDAGSTDHDDRYYTEAEVDAALTGKADTGHSHSGTDDHTHTAYETAVQEDQTYPGITTIAKVTEAQMAALAGSEDPNTYYVVVPNP